MHNQIHIMLPMSYQGFQVAAVRCDVRDRSDIDAAVQEALKQFGGLDIAVANAGTYRIYSNLLKN